MEVLLELPFARDIAHCELALLVICLNQVLDNGPGFPERDIRVGINNGRHPPIGIDGGKPFLLWVFHHNGLVRDRELLSGNYDLVWVRSGL